MKRVVISRRAIGYWVELEEEEQHPGLGLPKVTHLDGRHTFTLRGARRLGKRLLAEASAPRLRWAPDPDESYGYICRRGSQPG